MIVIVNLHQVHYRLYLSVGSSARLTGELLVLPVVRKVLLTYIRLPSYHAEEDTGRLLWFSVPLSTMRSYRQLFYQRSGTDYLVSVGVSVASTGDEFQSVTEHPR